MTNLSPDLIERDNRTHITNKRKDQSMTRQLIITHNGTEYHGANAFIRRTTLGMEDHGLMTFYLHCELTGGAEIGVGGYVLDTYDEAKKKRVGTAYGLDVIKQVLATVGVEQWEDLLGSHVIVLFDGPKSWGYGVRGIAHLVAEDKVLVFREHSDSWLGDAS